MFSKLMGSLDAAMKEASTEGLGSARRQAEVHRRKRNYSGAKLYWVKKIHNNLIPFFTYLVFILHYEVGRNIED